MQIEKISVVAEQVAEALLAKEMSMATAESCTGGWIAKILTDIAGSSQWFEFSVVSYSNRAKSTLLGVGEQTLLDFGAVSEPVVKEMVMGLLALCDVDVAVSVSGIAGPGGGSEEKPVGLVWFGWGMKSGEADAQSMVFKGDREAVRRQAVNHALQGILLRLGVVT